jgi:hypothetical protein
LRSVRRVGIQRTPAFLAKFWSNKKIWAALQGITGGTKSDRSQIDETYQRNGWNHKKQLWCFTIHQPDEHNKQEAGADGKDWPKSFLSRSHNTAGKENTETQYGQQNPSTDEDRCDFLL